VTEDEKLRRALSHLQTQRAGLGGDEVRAASTALLQRLSALTADKRVAKRGCQRGFGSSFVGRKAEFSVIKRRIQQLVEGQGRFVLIEGEAGLGKSRLVAEVREHVCGSDAYSPVQWLEGSAHSEGRVASYGLFSQIILQYAGITERDNAEESRSKLRSRLESLLQERSTEVLSYLETMTALHMGHEPIEQLEHPKAEVVRNRIRQAAQVFFASMTQTKPLVLFLEELHWIDEYSLELLHHLIPSIYRTRMLILGVSRPYVQGSHAKLREVMATAYHDRYDEIRLSPLSPTEGAQLVASLLHDESHALLFSQKVLEEAGGNPMLIENCVRSLVHIDYDRPHAHTPQRLVQKIAECRSTIEGERKVVTIMFADMAGFFSMLDELDLEDFRQIMNGCFRIIMDEVYTCDGTVNEFRGDGLMALFGAPIAYEDHAQRACYACIAIQKALVSYGENLKKRYGIDFRVRIGLNSGPVVVNSVDDDLRMEFRAQGDTAALAGKMESLATPGTILVTEQTYRLAKDLFEFEPLGKVSVKGNEQPVEAYLLKDKVRSVTERSQREVYSEMIGRDQELSKLELQILKAVNGEGSIVNVTGEAGIGKSRLLTELKKRDVRQRVRFLEGRAVSIGKNLSFHPVIDLLKQWARIREDDSHAVALNKLETAIRSVCSDQADEVFPFVGTMMGLKLSGRHAERVKGIVGEPLEKLVFKNVKELLVSSSNIVPIVIVMEDLHWADASSLLLLEALYRLTPTHRIVFINAFRPGYWGIDDATPETLKSRAPALPVVDIVLQPLKPHLSESLINNILNLKQLEPSMRGEIIDRAGGNPFFVEEIVRSLIDQGVVRAGERGLEVTDNIHSVVIPPTINEVLMARIDRLDEESRNLVKIASILGRSFFYRVLAEVVSRSEGLDDTLAYLKQIQLIREQMRMEELEYSFQHALVQEAAYESIPLPRRRQLHLKVAEAIERIFKESFHEFYGMLAYHYGRDDSPEKAEECLIKAGEEALKAAASNEALHYYQEALGIYRMLQGEAADPAKIAMLEKNIGLALFNRGHYIDAVKHFDEALNYYWGELPKNKASTAFRFASSFVTFLLAVYFPSRWFKRVPTPRDIEAVDLFYKKAEALVIIDPKRFFIEFFYFHATVVRFDLTKFKLGIGIFAGASPLFTFTGLSMSVGRKILDYTKPRLAAYDAKQLIRYDLLDTQHHFLKGNWNEIAHYDEELVNRMLRIGEMWDAAQHYYWHGLSENFRGDFEAARQQVSRLSEIAEAYENDIYHLLKHLLNIYLLVESCDFDAATAQLQRGIELVQKKGWGLSLFNMYSLKAWVQLSQKKVDEAGDYLDKADRVRGEIKAVPIQLVAFYRSQFQYNLHRLEDPSGSGRKKESSALRRNARKSGKMLVKTCQKAALYRTDAYRLTGVYYWLIGDRRRAVKSWYEAIRVGKGLGARPQVARTYAEMAVRAWSVRSESSDPFASRADEYLHEARALLGDLGLRHYLEEMNSKIGSMRTERSSV